MQTPDPTSPAPEPLRENASSEAAAVADVPIADGSVSASERPTEGRSASDALCPPEGSPEVNPPAPGGQQDGAGPRPSLEGLEERAGATEPTPEREVDPVEGATAPGVESAAPPGGAGSDGREGVKPVPSAEPEAPIVVPSPEEVAAIIAAARARNEAELLENLAQGDVLALREIVSAHFPEYWIALEAALACTATLFLKDNANPMALILVGSPSTGKTTVTKMFDASPITYRSDDFTPAAFVSQAPNVKREALPSIDLLPRIRHRLLVTPDLGTIFRGKEDYLVNQFKTITRVLDGDGYMTDKATHGKRGYKGDYLFAWLGATTPFTKTAWKVMAQLGSRLFFFQMGKATDCTVEDLMRTTEGLHYNERLDRCRKAVTVFLGVLLQSRGGLSAETNLNAIRSVSWDRRRDPKPVRERIAQFARLLAEMRGMRAEDVEPESPHRAHAVLSNLARARALLYGRANITEEDLPLVARIALDSVPHPEVFRALAQKGRLTVREVQEVMGAGSHNTAREPISDLLRTKVVVEEIGPPRAIRLADGWEWLDPRQGRETA